jgi:predicted DNA-binding transcriptional regulator YafY
METMVDENEKVLLDYTNYRGERSSRLVTPLRIHFGSSEWHPEPQWLLGAYDHAKVATRDFAMKDIHGWKPASI